MKKKKSISKYPNVDTGFFWDWDYKKMNFPKAYVSVIARILERGVEKDWEELIRFYGRDKIVNAIRNEIPFLPDYTIAQISRY